MFSIIIPTFNNLNYVKILLSSLKKNSAQNHEIIFHVNEGSDGTLDYLNKNNLKYTFSKNNVGLCTATNLAASKSSSKYILYSHDDMYFCPGWDTVLENEIKSLQTNAFYISATMIEKNGGHIQLDCGSNFKDFDEKKLLNKFSKINYFDYQGTHWAPHLIHKEYWDKIGGFSEEFNPGIGSDPDLNMKLWKEGVRIFKGINNFKVYHFVSIVIKRINVPTKNKSNIKSKASKIFLLKWGVSIKFFKKFYLNTNSEYLGPLRAPKKNIKFIFNYFLCKIYYLYVRLLYNKLYSKN